MRKCSGISTLRPLTTTSALGASGCSSACSSSTINMVVRLVSTEWVDILGNSFLLALHAERRAGHGGKRTEGDQDFATHRRKVSKSHLLPLSRRCGASFVSAAVRHSRVVGPDGSPCSPERATNFADVF